VNRLAAFAGDEGAVAFAGVVAHLAFFVQGVEVRSESFCKRGGGDEEFDKGFLEDEAAWWAPAVDGVGGGEAVDGGLGGDGPVAFLLRQGCEFGSDEGGFGGEGGGFGPGELFWGGAGEVGGEEVAYFCVGGGCAP